VQLSAVLCKFLFCLPDPKIAIKLQISDQHTTEDSTCLLNTWKVAGSSSDGNIFFFNENTTCYPTLKTLLIHKVTYPLSRLVISSRDNVVFFF